MTTITEEFREQIVTELLKARENWDGFDSTFSTRYGINESVFNQLKNGKREKLLKEGKWITLARELGVTLEAKKWTAARTDVFVMIEEDILFCKQYSKARIFVDECGIGKTYAAKYITSTVKNCFYVDASQCKTKQAFVRELAKTLGVDHNDKYIEVKANIKYWLQVINLPIVIIDEAGDLEYNAFLELKEFWNATENSCGWYMLGADGLRKQIEKGIRNKKVGYREIFSRFSESFTSTVPNGTQERLAFYNKLITDVLRVNVENLSIIPSIVKECIVSDKKSTQIGGLRRAESLLILNQ